MAKVWKNGFRLGLYEEVQLLNFVWVKFFKKQIQSKCMHETIIYTETTFEKISFLKLYYSRVRNKTTSISTPLLFRIRAYCRTLSNIIDTFIFKLSMCNIS